MRRHYSQGGCIFSAAGVGSTLGASKTTARIIKKHAMLAGHRTGSDPMFLHMRWLQKLGNKVQVLNANLCMASVDAYPTKSPARNASVGSTCCRAAVVADGTPPTASCSERAGDDRCLLTSGLRSFVTNLRLFDGYTSSKS
jgi:hypothetical protein